jgi:SAM-dependent methyltransferase
MLRTVRGFLQRRAGGDPDAELRFWLDQWEPHIRSGLLFSPSGLELSGDTEVADTYEGRRWQEARAQVQRVLREAEIEDADFFQGRVVLEIGPGPVGLPEACGAAVALAVEPLAGRMLEAGLLLGGDAVYLTCGAEELPLLDASVDVVVARNSLDHVRDPQAVLNEVARVLRPGGTLILNVDIDGEATAEEPHAFTAEAVRRLLGPLQVERERVLPEPHGHVGRQLVVVAVKPANETSRL